MDPRFRRALNNRAAARRSRPGGPLPDPLDYYRTLAWYLRAARHEAAELGAWDICAGVDDLIEQCEFLEGHPRRAETAP